MTTERPADDMGALLAWLKEQALEAHHREGVCSGLGTTNAKYMHGGELSAYNRVIAKIENSRINQRPHVPIGWDEVS